MRVLQSFPDGRSTTNPYLVQLVDRLRPHAEVLGFTWKRALIGRYDVFHAHFPETLMVGRSPARRLAKRLLFRALLARLLLTHTAVVRTMHTVETYEPRPQNELRLLGRLDRRAALWIRLNLTTETPLDAPQRTIKLGDYREWFAAHHLPSTVRGRLLFFGLIRPYKNVGGLINAFIELPDIPTDPDLSLHIIGKPSTPDLGEDVLRAAAADVRINVNLGHASDGALVEDVGLAELIVLPHKEMHNSSAVLLALSLGRPVLVPANEVTEALRDEVGEGWVLTYTGTLTGESILEALTRVRATGKAQKPDLSARNWEDIAARHLEAYETALRTVRTG